MNRMIKLMPAAAVLLAGFSVADVFAAEAAAEAPAEAAETPAEPAEAPAEKPKKKPKKLPSYSVWDQAAAVAEAYEQPIIAFIDVKGDKTSPVMLRTEIFNVRKDFIKEFVLPNAVYYTYTVPNFEDKKANNNNQKKRDKNEPVKPDLTKVKESERMMVTRISTGGSQQGGQPKPMLPMIAVVSPGGKILGLAHLDHEGPAYGNLVASLKDAMEQAKYPVTVGKKVQKAITVEAKKVAELEKRQRK